MNTVEIKQLEPKEWRVYKEVQLKALRQDPQAFGASYQEWVTYSDEKWKERPYDKDTLLFVAMDEKNPVGMVGVHFALKEEGKVAHMWGMYVSPSLRSQGLGRQLLQKALDKVQETVDVVKVQLMVNEDQLAAVELYKTVGFEVVGTKDWVLGDGKSHELLVMNKVVKNKL